jgi:hypothetical protein
VVHSINGQRLDGLSAGLLCNTALTGVPRICTPGTDYIGATTVVSAANGGTNTSSPAFSTLTDVTSVTWNAATALIANAELTLVHTTTTRSINLLGLLNGGFYTLVMKQDSTGGAAATLGTGCTWLVGGSTGFTASTTLALTTTASATNILAFTYDGTTCYANLR